MLRIALSGTLKLRDGYAQSHALAKCRLSITPLLASLQQSDCGLWVQQAHGACGRDGHVHHDWGAGLAPVHGSRGPAASAVQREGRRLLVRHGLVLHGNRYMRVCMYACMRARSCSSHRSDFASSQLEFLCAVWRVLCVCGGHVQRRFSVLSSGKCWPTPRTHIDSPVFFTALLLQGCSRLGTCTHWRRLRQQCSRTSGRRCPRPPRQKSGTTRTSMFAPARAQMLRPPPPPPPPLLFFGLLVNDLYLPYDSRAVSIHGSERSFLLAENQQILLSSASNVHALVHRFTRPNHSVLVCCSHMQGPTGAVLGPER